MTRPAVSSHQVGLYGLPVRPVHAAARDRIPVPECPVCGCREACPRFEVDAGAWHLVVCPDCGLGRLHPLPTADVLTGLYPDDYYGEPGRRFTPLIERLVRVVGRRNVAFLARGLGPGARVLDVGCGRGAILGPLADRSLEVHGVEISRQAVRDVEPRAKIRIAARLRDADYPAGYFDAVVMWHVLEHVPDPAGTLHEVHRILKPGGRLVVAVPNFSSVQARWTGAGWFHLDLPRHLYHFRVSGLMRLLCRCGFEPRSQHHFSLRQNPFGWIQSAMNLNPRWPRNGLYQVLHRPTPGSQPVLSRAMRLWLWLWMLLLTPPALVASVLAALARSGATVHVVAERVEPSDPVS